MQDPQYFPLNYEDSRRRFQDQAKQWHAHGALGKWEIPSQTDRNLFVDHLWLPPKKQAEKLLVILSGIHGSETYAGAAIQSMFFQEILPRLNRDQLGIFIVHAMNPYGFKNHQRCTENLVNLNRNFSVSGDMFAKKNEASFRLNEKFLPHQPVTGMESFLLKNLRMQNEVAYFGDVTMDELTKGIAPGQFERPEHLEYGGRALEPQSRHLIEFLRRWMPEFKDIIALDLHTGLGDRGRLHMLTGGDSKQLNASLFQELFDPGTDKEFYEFTPPEADGFYEVFGATNSAFAELALPSQRVCAVTMEFGTFGHSVRDQIDGLNIFFLGHQGQFYGFSDKDVEAQVQTTNFLRSYPQTDEWRSSVVRASRGTFERILQRSKVL